MNCIVSVGAAGLSRCQRGNIPGTTALQIAMNKINTTHIIVMQ